MVSSRSCSSVKPTDPSNAAPATCTSSIFFLMRIVRAELFELALPLLEPFVISGGTMTERRSMIIVLRDDAGHVGYGECPPFELPFYSEETLAEIGRASCRERV